MRATWWLLGALVVLAGVAVVVTDYHAAHEQHPRRWYDGGDT